MVRGKILALDIGSNVIGIALSDSSQVMAFPREVCRWNGDEGVLEHCLKHITEENPLAYVVLGYVEGGNNDSFLAAFEQVVHVLEHLGLRHVLQEEHVSTIEAENRVEELGLPRGQRLDSIAAQIILERHLEKLSN